MRVEPGGEIVAPPSGDPVERDRLLGLIQRGADPGGELEVLAVREHRMLRRTAGALQRVAAQARRSALDQALQHMKSAARTRLWKGVAQAACQLAQTVIGAAGSGSGSDTSTSQGLVSAAGTAADLCLESHASEGDRSAFRAQAEGEQRLSESGAAEEWQRNIRAAEGKMLERLEAFLRAEHEGRMACLRG